jgi:hypothetical protein
VSILTTDNHYQGHDTIDPWEGGGNEEDCGITCPEAVISLSLEHVRIKKLEHLGCSSFFVSRMNFYDSFRILLIEILMVHMCASAHVRIATYSLLFFVTCH